MEEILEQTETQKEETIKKVAAVGVPYPVESIQDTLTTVEKLVSENGTGVIITKEDITKVTGKKQNTLVLYFSTYQQYGILDKVHGKGFVPTPLYNKYRDKVYSHHEREALLEIFKNPSLYSKIIEKLNHTNLPSEEKFPTLLKGEPYNVNENSADKASKIFFENARFLKVIDSNNKLVFNQSTTNINGNSDLGNPPPPPPPKKDEIDLFELPIPLGGKRRAYLRYPLEDLSKKDIRVIKKALEFVESSILDEEPE